mmetsp:Transcript_41753/g.102833  ORF Transcript_41753/g.102833 Transcript_41753/m.102833 type:complete len:212 (-) Transcript_41753:1247-1882(-)
MIHSFQNAGYFSRPSSSSARCAAMSPISRSTIADFIHTRSLAPRSRIFCSRMRARSGSAFSNSSLNAASQMFSLSGLATNASSSTSRAPGTSFCSHRSLAAMSHSTSAWGQYCTARFSNASMRSGCPVDFSSSAASFQSPSLPGYTDRAWLKMWRAVITLPRLRHSSASAVHVRSRSSSSTPTPMVTRTTSWHTHAAGGSFFSAVSASFSQ